ncbi:MAG: polyprenyl synthetase family protein [Ignavibacteria bacterium]|nr:polyprenyl synthetase family protein [Bacteroidota bacterium]MSQ45501.1 polyprenyl synthetase family protein [Ignavibacteria bacterium]
MINSLSLSQIQNPINKELYYFSKYFKNSLKSSLPIVDTIIKYIIRQKGKQIRPTLVLLAAKSVGEINDSSYRGAALVEILHTATLVHDDVVDDADTRRGFPSINSIWKNKIAVLIGDYLLSTGLMLSIDKNDFEFLKVTSRSVKLMSEGEILQIHKSRTYDINEETYFKIISGKTASLFTTCVDVGAFSTTKKKSFHNALHIYGTAVGMAFQIKDDILDYTSRTNILGKPIGGDLREKKITLPLIYALKNVPKNESSKIVSMIRKGVTTSDVLVITNFVTQNGGIDYAIEKATEYSNSAIKSIEVLPNTPSKTSLLNFANFVISRNK